MRRIPDKQRSAREKYYEELYLKEKNKAEEWNALYISTLKKLHIAEDHIAELEYFQNLTPEEREEIKLAVKKISEFQSSELGKFMGSSLMPLLPMLRRIGTI